MAVMSGDTFPKANNIAQLGVIGKDNLGSKVDVYGKAGVGTKRTTTWEAGFIYKVNQDWDINAGYRYINTKRDDKSNISCQGPVVGLSYRFSCSSKSILLYTLQRQLLYTLRLQLLL